MSYQPRPVRGPLKEEQERQKGAYTPDLNDPGLNIKT